MTDHRARELHKLCTKEFRGEYTEAQARRFLGTNFPKLDYEEEQCWVTPETLERDVQLALRKQQYLRLGRENYQKAKQNKTEQFMRVLERTKAKGQKRTQDARVVRQKLANGEELEGSELKVQKWLERRRARAKAERDFPRTQECILAAARKVAESNGTPEKTEELFAKFSEFANLPQNKYFEQIRRFKLADRERRRARDRIRNKLRRTWRPRARPWELRGVTESTRAKHRAYIQRYRKEKGFVLQLSTIRCRNRLFGVNGTLNVQCDEQLFLRRILRTLPCAYCGLRGEQTAGGKQALGLDRIDSSQHYHLDNIVPCCTRCNMAKNVLSVSDFISHCAKITANHKAASSPPIRFSETACFYCGTGGKLGVDHVVPGKAECVPCCSLCNYIKRLLPVQEFFELAASVRDGVCQSQADLRQIHEEMKSEKAASSSSKKPKRKSATPSVADRDEEDTKVVSLRSAGSKIWSKIYHTSTSCYYVARHAISATKIEQDARVAIQAGRVPCRVCRLHITESEQSLLQNTDATKKRRLDDLQASIKQRGFNDPSSASKTKQTQISAFFRKT